MTQTPLEAEEAAGTLAASADLSAAPREGAEPWTDIDEASLEAGPVTLKARMRHTPQGLLAAGALVTGILLATAAIVWVATAAPRRHPWATAVALRRRR